ncbi:MAG: RNA polymerase sigma factor [Defluviitaleaceae bacterium]|nr:RNA polymerase sigma factor [Defluviitaleaceae bacterium]
MNVLEFERFLEVNGRDVYSFCGYLAGEARDDLYQETALAAFEMIGRLDPSQNPKSFLFSIAVGKWKNIRRKAVRRQGIAPESPLEELPANPDRANPPEEAALSNQQREIIQKALGQIKDKFRVPLILHYFDESPLEAIAKILQIPEGTVKSRLYKGRALLKKALEREGITYG